MTRDRICNTVSGSGMIWERGVEAVKAETWQWRFWGFGMRSRWLLQLRPDSDKLCRPTGAEGQKSVEEMLSLQFLCGARITWCNQ